MRKRESRRLQAECSNSDKHRYENQVAPDRDFGVVTNPVFRRVTSTVSQYSPRQRGIFGISWLSVSGGML
jgi:hypothetical protein